MSITVKPPKMDIIGSMGWMVEVEVSHKGGGMQSEMYTDEDPKKAWAKYLELCEQFHQTPVEKPRGN